MRCRWCERSASSSASSRGRLRSMLQGGRWAIRAAARQGASSSAHAAGAPEGRRGSHLFEQLRRIEISIIKKARKRELGVFVFQVPIVYAQQRLSLSGSAGAGSRGGGPTRNSITRSKGPEPGGAKRPASAAAPGCASAPAAASCKRRGRRPCR